MLLDLINIHFLEVVYGISERIFYMILSWAHAMILSFVEGELYVIWHDWVEVCEVHLLSRYIQNVSLNLGDYQFVNQGALLILLLK
jgi:hypothetical protein